MKIQLTWSEPIELGRFYETDHPVGYRLDLNLIPREAGIYIFIREHGNIQEAIYIGKGQDLRVRLKAQFNNFKLMQGIKNGDKGKKKLIYATVKNTRTDIGLQLIQAENALIQHFNDQGHRLLNKNGLYAKYDEITSIFSEQLWLLPDHQIIPSK